MPRRLDVPALVLGVVLALLPGASVAGPASTRADAMAGCVMLLGSYPAEVALHLERADLDDGTPTVLGGRAFYTGAIDGHRVVIAIAGPAPSVARATTAMALRHFRCVTAVVYTGTGGGHDGAGIGDVSVPRRWTDDDGATFHAVDRRAFAVAREVAATPLELETTAAVNDGPCACSGLARSLQTFPTLRTPVVRVGGDGLVIAGGEDLVCSPGAGVLAECDPCPPSGSSTSVVPSRAAASLRPGSVLGAAVRAVRHRALVPGWRQLVARAPDRARRAPTYVVQDMQTTGAFAAARAAQVPFVAFRGVSDPEEAGDAWPLVWLVYQQLAADNAAIAAHAWLAAWSRSVGGAG
ncbi:MAG: hypothetical protein F2667_12085 [Actinobacteria bacterium]|uniref:Unannotated protein n=1 Tax=freshwater metagenome TaxID=449393 RepID=A0A6J6RV11_9ZZZZ|nr:hypothetical protein [Actinomycetota bacterium]